MAFVGRGEVEAAVRREALHGGEAVAVAGRPAAQRGLGVDAAGARDDHRGREQLREVSLEVGRRARAGAATRDVDAVERLAERAGVEPDRRGLAEQLVRVEQRRQARA